MTTVRVRNLRLALYILTGFLIGGLVALAVLPGAREQLFPGATIKSVGQALVGGPFTLTDQTGKRVTTRLPRPPAGVLVSRLPDVCPTALQMAAAYKAGCKAEQITLLISRPERDTPSRWPCVKLPPGGGRLTGRDRGGHQGLSRLLQARCRPQIECRLHHGSFGHHLRYGTGRRVPHPLCLHRQRRCHGGSAQSAVALKAQPFNQAANRCSVPCTSV